MKSITAVLSFIGAVAAVALPIQHNSTSSEPRDYRFSPYGSPSNEQHYKRGHTRGDCGMMSSGVHENARAQWDALMDMTSYCNAPAKSCVRLKCDETTGTYLCNDTPEDVAAPCDAVGKYACMIDSYCRTHIDAALSGQVFDEQGWRVVVGYANCKHEWTRRPGTYQGDGPNGKPDMICKDCIVPIH